MALYKPNEFQDWEPICREHLDNVRMKGGRGEVVMLRGEDNA